MQSKSNIFLQVASRVSSSHILHEILHRQQNTFDIQPYKFEGCWGENLLKNYNSVNSRYSVASTVEQDPNNWNQNERRLFVLFIVCYTYFLQREQKSISPEIWTELSNIFFYKKPEFLHFQYLNLLKTRKRVVWSSTEDRLLIKATQKLEPGKWNAISRQIFYESGQQIFRTPKHCRQRWLNHLDQSKKHGDWTSKEDLIIFQYALSKGKKWSRIVSQLDGTRTEHMIKNRYNSLIAKWRSGKKQKQDDVAKKIYSMLLQNVQSNRSAQKDHQSQVVQKQDQNIKNEAVESNPIQIQPLVRQQSSQPIAPTTIPQPYPYNCILDYNHYLWMNEYYYRNNYPWIPVDPRAEHIFPISSQSSFTTFRSQEPTKQSIQQS